MAKMNSKYKYMYDAAASVSLLTKGAAAKVATFTGTEITLDKLDGYWNHANNGVLADQVFAVVVDVTAIGASARTATMTFASVVATDTFTLSDGVHSATFIADTDFAVGIDNTATAANAVTAINTAYTAGTIAISATSALGVITLTNHLGTGGTITEAETTITTTAFAGNNETYSIELEYGPVGFGTSLKTGKLTIAAPGQYVILVDADTLKATKADLAAIRLAGTLTGVAPSLTAFAWLAGCIC